MTRVFTPAGTVAHLLPWNGSPNTAGEEALCGRSAWPDLWHGTGSQDEEERAQDMRLCERCSALAPAEERREMFRL